MIDRIKRLFTGEPSVAGLVANIQRQQEQLSTAASKLKGIAETKRKQAEALAQRAAIHTQDAEWAERVANKFGDLISK